MMRSMPPASAHLALMPVPAPPPMIGLPAATWARNRSRHCSRVNMETPGEIVVRGISWPTWMRIKQHGRHGNRQVKGISMAVLLIGTLDTKGSEYQFVRDLLTRAGVETLVLDAGVLNPPVFQADIGRDQVYAAAGTIIAEIQKSADRGKAIEAAARGAAHIAL